MTLAFDPKGSSSSFPGQQSTRGERVPLPSHLTQEEMLGAITELDQAIYSHDQWTENLYATLICHLDADTRDLSDEAHRNCRFGQWYYSCGTKRLTDWAGFSEVEVEHHRMHQYATSLLRAVSRGIPVSLQDYERFVSAMTRTRLEVESLKRDLEVALYNIDPLTGIPGRLQMLQKLRENRNFVTRDIHPCAIAMLDIDRFKSVNDAYGHPAGDQVLKDIANYVQTHMRQYDLLFRYGGEEFLLCLPDADTEMAREICDRLRSELGNLSHAANGDGSIKVTVSFGVAQLSADYSVEEAITRADQALYAAKAAGRDRVFVWSPALADNPVTT